MSFLTHGPNQRAYESQSSVWSGPMKQGVKRAGRWLNGQSPQPTRPGQSAESAVYARLPVLEALELHRWSVTSDIQWPRSNAVSWTLGPQIVLPAGGPPMPVELTKFTVPAGVQPRYREAVPVWFNVQRKGTRRAGRWITSQPRQPRIVPESRYDAFDIVNLLSGSLPEQLRKFVQGQPYLSRATEAVNVWGVKIPNPAAGGTSEEIRRFLATVDRQAKFLEASAMSRPQIPINADLYSVRRMITPLLRYYDRFSGGNETLRRVEIPAAFPPLPIELQVFALNSDSQPTQRATSLLWIPQLQALSLLPEELKRYVYGNDPQVLRQVLSWMEGVQIANANPPLPIELQQFVVGTDSIVTQRSISGLLNRYMPDTFPLPIELQQFLITEPRQRPFVSQSSVTVRKIDELVAMPMELRHYVETAFQRYRSHYLILRGTFIAAPVPDVQVEYKYFRGYTIIKKSTRLDS